MKLFKRFTIILLALLMVCSVFVSCKDEEPEEEDPGDEFTGSISGGDEGSGEGENEGTTLTPPLDKGSDDLVVEIRTADDLKNIAQKGTFILMNDIDMSGVDFEPIGNYAYPFMGTLKSADGENFKISNLKTEVSEVTLGPTVTYTYLFAGLFGATLDAKITNITVENADISAQTTDEYCFATAGILAGYMINTEVTDCSVSGKVTSKSKLFNAYTGGFCGILEGGKITRSVSSTELLSDDSKNRAVSGGIAAYALLDPTVEHCTTSGSVKAVSSYGVSYAGGLVGNTRKASFTACRSENDVYAETVSFSSKEPLVGAAYAGGIAAVSSAQSENAKTTFTRCYAIDKTVIAKGNDNAAYAGGIAGYIEYSDFTHCYSLADVEMYANAKISYAAGGFAKISSSAGESSAQNYVADYNIKGCFVYGNVTVDHANIAHALFGTFFGFITTEESKASIKNSYYNQSADFSLNGASNHKLLQKNGSARLGEYFTESHITDFGWNPSEWETQNGYLTAK